MSVEDILNSIPPDIDGITISGGEPFLQADFLLALVGELRKQDCSIVVFSGFYLSEIKKITNGLDIS